MAKYGEKVLQELTALDIEETGVSHSKAVDLHRSICRILRSTQDPANLWNIISQELLAPAHPHALHRLLYHCTYKNWNSELIGPPPAWIPTL